MQRYFRRFFQALSILSDSLQVAGFDWKQSVVSSLAVAVGTWIIGHLTNVSLFQLAVWIPVAFAATMAAATLARIWPMTGKTALKLGFPTIVALDKLSDPGKVKRRDEAAHKQWQLWAQIESANHELASLQRRQSRHQSSPATRRPTPQEMEVHEHIEDLAGKKDWVDVEFAAALENLKSDFYYKLFSGELIAHGFALPVVHGKTSLDIPCLEWHFLRFDGAFELASGQGISYRVVSVRRA